jgi:hypothetical protein
LSQDAFHTKQKAGTSPASWRRRDILASDVDPLDPTIWISTSWPLQRNGMLTLFRSMATILFIRVA